MCLFERESGEQAKGGSMGKSGQVCVYGIQANRSE